MNAAALSKIVSRASALMDLPVALLSALVLIVAKQTPLTMRCSSLGRVLCSAGRLLSLLGPDVVNNGKTDRQVQKVVKEGMVVVGSVSCLVLKILMCTTCYREVCAPRPT